MKTETIEDRIYRDAAIQQFTGMHYSEGREVRAVCLGMGLTAEEWPEIKENCPWLNEYELAEIEEYIEDLINGEI